MKLAKEVLLVNPIQVSVLIIYFSPLKTMKYFRSYDVLGGIEGEHRGEMG